MSTNQESQTESITTTPRGGGNPKNPETDPNSEKIPPAEISPVSQTTAAANKPETDPNSEKIPPAEISPVSQTTAATNKPEPDPNSEKIPPAEISSVSETTPATNKPETDPNSKKLPPAKISPVSQATEAANKPETDDAQSLKQGSEPDPSDIRQAKTETSSEKSPVSQTTAATNKPETGVAKALKQDSKSDPKDNQQPENEAASDNSSPKTTPINNSRTEDGEALKRGPAIDAEDQTTSENTFPTKNESKTTNDRETDGRKATLTDSAAGADPHNIPEISPVENETASTHSSPSKNGSTKVTAITEPDTEARRRDSATEADPRHQKSSFSKSKRKNFKIVFTWLKHKRSPSESSPASQGTQDQTADVKKHAELTAQDLKDIRTLSKLIEQDLKYIDKQAEEPGNGHLKEIKREASEYLDKLKAKLEAHEKVEKKDFEELRNGVEKLKEWPKQLKELNKLSELIEQDLKYIDTQAEEPGDGRLKKEKREASEYFHKLKAKLEAHEKVKKKNFRELIDDAEKLKVEKEDFEELRNDVKKLMLQVPITHTFGADKDQRHKEMQFGSKARQRTNEEVLGKVPQLHAAEAFETSMEFKDFKARYNELPLKLKLCLLCFSVFLENAIIKKRLMVQWWVAEGFCENDANECFTQLIEKGFIVPENKNRSLSVGSCRMHPFDRSALVKLAEREKFFNFGKRGEPTQNFSGSFQACLVGEGLISFQDLWVKELKVNDLEKLHLLFNVDEQILDFKLGWFAKMKNLNFLYLGRWKALAKDHIEVDDIEFLKGLENMSCLKFLSLQGVSNIIALPNSILRLTSLSMLDLRACYNLETIPDGIGSLKNLTHLDMSECYLLAHMPKSLQSLEKLQVLKGFVVGRKPEEKSKLEQEKKKSCTLHDLERLKGLIKLCIYTDSSEFPEAEDVKALGKLENLGKLTITWGGGTLRGDPATGKQSENGNKKGKPTAEKTKAPDKQDPPASESTDSFPWTLEKLDLKCFPKRTAPDWLKLHNLKGSNKLKKLYIRGGRLSDLGQYQDIDLVEKKTWKVEVLRLKYLSEIEMEWDQLQDLFPELVYLEQVSCPKLTLFPCDSNGVWINKNKNNPKAPSANHHCLGSISSVHLAS